MTYKIYQIDAFADKIFSGNPAAVVPLDEWLPDEILQNIAMENNLSETVFFPRKDSGDVHIRWFTPTVEVNLCGHATLAAAYVLFNCEGYKGSVINFHSDKSGSLSVTKKGALLSLNFPADIPQEVKIDEMVTDALGAKPLKAFKGKTDLLLVYETEACVRQLRPNFEKAALLAARGIIATAAGTEVDFVSRFFGPQVGVNEDPVTGSAHTMLIPYWAGVFGKTELTARQVSQRGGNLSCKLMGDRVEISGEARLYMKGEIFADQENDSSYRKSAS